MKAEFVPAETKEEREARIAKAQALEDKLFAKRPPRQKRRQPKLPTDYDPAAAHAALLASRPDAPVAHTADALAGTAPWADDKPTENK